MKLFESGRIGKLALKNRIVMAPMGTGAFVETDGSLSQRGIDYYRARAKGGTGLIITGSSRVSQEIDRELASFLPSVTDAKHAGWLNRLADSMHEYGAKVAVQITAGAGRVILADVVNRGGAAAPSALPCVWNPSVMTRELTIEEIERLVKDFEVAAQIMGSSRIDAVELHGHEGYLFDQFMTPLWNKRTDKYGGDLDGRLRFSLEVIEAIKRGAGDDFPIIYRFGLKHYLEGGREVDEGLEIARRLETAGVDALDVDAGCYETSYWPHPPATQPPGCMVDMAEMVKKVVKIPVMAVGRLGYPQLAEEVLQEGKADFIILGRALLADPEWPNKVRDKNWGDICPCVGCHEGCLKRIWERKHISCAVNPTTGMENELTINPAEKVKYVLVIGGGPGGMEAARVAALRGHKVALWEKANVLGGNLIPASVPDFKCDYAALIDYLSTQIEKLGVNIVVGREATPEQIQEMKPDVVFIATGSSPIIPEIPGMEKEKVVTAVDVLLGRKEAGESVVVMGGGIVGCETALFLSQKGKRVTIIEILDSVMRDMPSVNRMHLLKLLGDTGVKILSETRALGILDEGVTIADKNGKRTLKADTVILALGFKPEQKLMEVLKDKVPEVYSIGDCVEPRKVMNAIWEGFNAALLI